MNKNIISFSLLILLIISAGCSSALMREDELYGSRDSQESVALHYLLSSAISKSMTEYQKLSSPGEWDFAGAMQYVQLNRNWGPNVYEGFRTPKGAYYTFVGILKQLDVSRKQAEEKGNLTYAGIFMIFETALWQTCTDMHGSIMYSEALRGREGIFYPKYDSQDEVYKSLNERITKAVQLIQEGKAKGQKIDLPQYDLLYSGDIDKWIKFGNSIRLRLLMRASNDPFFAAQIRDLATQPLMSTDAESGAMKYFGTGEKDSWPLGPTNTKAENEFKKFRPCLTLVDSLRALGDPRLPLFAAPLEEPWTSEQSEGGKSVTEKIAGFDYTYKWEWINPNSTNIKRYMHYIYDQNILYSGYGAGYNGQFLNVNGNYKTGESTNTKISMLGKLFRQDSHALLKAVMMNADEVQYLLAEASVKGLIANGDAKGLYEKGIQLSMARWGMTIPSDYLTQAKVAFPSDKKLQLEKIALQKWLGLFFVTTESYFDYRRTKLPNIERNGYLYSAEEWGWNGERTFAYRYRYSADDPVNNNIKYLEAVKQLIPATDDEYAKMWLLQLVQ